jgi:hypothetical protein
MILDILDKFKSIIDDYEIKKFQFVGSAYQIIGEIIFKDQTMLLFRDYLFLDGSRKHSFHWQDAQKTCIIRWDNAPHHQTITTFPFHQHSGDKEIVRESKPMNLEKALEFISQ